jgi:hypothetical protein
MLDARCSKLLMTAAAEFGKQPALVPDESDSGCVIQRANELASPRISGAAFDGEGALTGRRRAIGEGQDHPVDVRQQL